MQRSETSHILQLLGDLEKESENKKKVIAKIRWFLGDVEYAEGVLAPKEIEALSHQKLFFNRSGQNLRVDNTLEDIQKIQDLSTERVLISADLIGYKSDFNRKFLQTTVDLENVEVIGSMDKNEPKIYLDGYEGHSCEIDLEKEVIKYITPRSDKKQCPLEGCDEN